jgi:hypothetical protein
MTIGGGVLRFDGYDDGAEIHERCAHTPSPPLPRKRGTEQTVRGVRGCPRTGASKRDVKGKFEKGLNRLGGSRD